MSGGGGGRAGEGLCPTHDHLQMSGADIPRQRGSSTPCCACLHPGGLILVLSHCIPWDGTHRWDFEGCKGG